MVVQALKQIETQNTNLLKEDAKALNYLSDLFPRDDKIRRRIKMAYSSGAIDVISKYLGVIYNIGNSTEFSARFNKQKVISFA